MADAARRGSDARCITALEYSRSRRRRIDETLRKTLVGQREELARREAALTDEKHRVELEANTRGYYLQRLDAMLTASRSFAINDLSDCRAYINVVSERLSTFEAALSQAEARLQEGKADIAKTLREIALNNGRIDVCGQRIDSIRRKLEEEASKASDEDAEEAAIARRFQTVGAAA